MIKLFKDLLMILIGTGMFAYLAGGFVAGMVWCKDCEGLLGNTVGRLFIGMVTGIMSAIYGGFPPSSGGGGPSLNAWPFIFSCWLIFFVAALVWFRPHPE